jgi:asparagine synthase (glutamine-hydrolysing)
MGKALQVGNERVHDRWINAEAGVALGRESLGIFDPRPQPAFNTSRTLALVMEGKLFDTLDLRKKLTRNGLPASQATDPELALYLFESEGLGSFSQLHGIFALGIYDARTQQLILANDRFGLRPLYYTHRDDLFAFAGEIKGLLALKGISREIDHAAVADFFAFEHVLADKTLFREIRLLPPATILVVKNRSLKWHTYWSLEFSATSPERSGDDWRTELAHLLSKAVERRLETGHTVGLPLSGGFDSCTLLAVASQMLGVSLPTFTYGLPKSREIHRARQAARLMGVPHRTLHLERDYLSSLAEPAVLRTEGLLNCLSSHGFALQAMAPDCQVIMLGNGGDTLLDAFRSYRPQLLQMQGDLVGDYYRIVNNLFSEEQATRLFCDAYYPRVKGQAYTSLESSLADLTPNSVDNIYDAHRLREFNRRSVLQGLFTINHYLEYTEPYYDYDLVEFALKIPTQMRCDRLIQKQLLSSISPSLGYLLTEPRGKLQRLRRRLQQTLPSLWGILDLSRISRSGPLRSGAHSSSTLSYLLRTVDREWSEELLLSPRTLERGYFRPQTIQRMVQNHMSGKRDLARQLGALMTFELWHRVFCD